MRKKSRWPEAGSRLCLTAIVLFALAGCSTQTMHSYVAQHCHGGTAGFSTYTLEYANVPGFIFDVIDTSLHGALARQGLSQAEPAQADIRIRTVLEVIERNAPQAGDDFGETVAPNELHRFVTHLTVDIFELPEGRKIWMGAIDRAHAIHGGETFHNERAVLLISGTFDEMFVGLTDPCE